MSEKQPLNTPAEEQADTIKLPVSRPHAGNNKTPSRQLQPPPARSKEARDTGESRDNPMSPLLEETLHSGANNNHQLVEEETTLKQPAILPEDTTKRPTVLPETTLKRPAILPEDTIKQPAVLPEVTLKRPAIETDITTKQHAVLPEATLKRPAIKADITTKQHALKPPARSHTESEEEQAGASEHLTLDKQPEQERASTSVAQIDVEVPGTHEVVPAASDTPRPAILDEEVNTAVGGANTSLSPGIDTPHPAVDSFHEDAGKQVTPPALSSPLKPRVATQHRLPLRNALALLLLALLISSMALFWHDISDTHLYLYTIDAHSGQIAAQQDLGGGYQGTTTITTAAQEPAALSFGISAAQARQEILTVGKHSMEWHIATAPGVPFPYTTLSATPTGYQVAGYAGGVQVLAPGGRLLWHLEADQPLLGAHSFQPAFDSTTLYTVKSTDGLIAAYDLRTGSGRWVQTLDDQLQYSAPPLLNDTLLYVAGDNNLYALNTANGRIRWQETRPTRTLLYLDGGAHGLLLSAGAPGLAALDPGTGSPIWTFNGAPPYSSLTSTQFYQAAIGRDVRPGGGETIYATGISWDTQKIQAQLWLYAVDAATGIPRWSERISSAMPGVDAGRTFTPLVDTRAGLVILQQVRDDGERIVSAYDVRDGAQRWSTPLAGVTDVGPALAQTSGGALVLLATAANSQEVLHNWSLLHILLAALAGGSLLGLLLLWLRPWLPWRTRLRRIKYALPRYLIYPLKLGMRLWRLSHTLVALMLIALVLGAGLLEYEQLNQPRNSQYQVAAQTGAVQWQRLGGVANRAMLVDGQGSILDTVVGENLHQLSALDNGGSTRWTTFASEGTFSLPGETSPAGTVLIELSGHSSLDYRFAPDDPAYAHPLDHVLNLSLLNRATGRTIWQRAIVKSGDQQRVVVLGADAKYIYLTSTPNSSAAGGNEPTTQIQLLAIDQATGNLAWRAPGPQESAQFPHDDGKLLSQGKQVIWQVAGNIYALDVSSGEVRWHRFIQFDNFSTLSGEEAQMSEAAGILFIVRGSEFHALNPASGEEYWSLPNPGLGGQQTPAGISAMGRTVLIYGGGQIQAIDAATQRPLWSQKQVDEVLELQISDDGQTLYTLLSDSIEGDAPAEALVAFDMKTGAARWTFQPADPATFSQQQSGGFQYQHGVIFTTICYRNAPGGFCVYERLYALDGRSGETLWKVEATRIFDMHMSADGNSILFQTTSSEWEDFVGRFKG